MKDFKNFISPYQKLDRPEIVIKHILQEKGFKIITCDHHDRIYDFESEKRFTAEDNILTFSILNNIENFFQMF